MKKMHEKIFSALKDFTESEEVKKVLETSEVDKSEYYLLNPQVKILLFLNREIELVAICESNGSNGFTEFKRTYPLK